jgi:hypothetical protein
MDFLNERITTRVSGHVVIKDKNTNEILLDKGNAIHNRNMALALARGLANETNHWIHTMEFGNGGTYVEPGSSGAYQWHYNSPNVIDPAAKLYHKTYSEDIDDITTSNGNQVVTSTGSIENTFLVICTCTLSAAESNLGDQRQDDSFSDVLTSSSDTETNYSFDELCLKTSDDLLLAHIIFNPIEKTANREIIITYTLTISIS